MTKRQIPIAWIAQHENGRIIHFATKKGWIIDVVAYAGDDTGKQEVAKCRKEFKRTVRLKQSSERAEQTVGIVNTRRRAK